MVSVRSLAGAVLGLALLALPAKAVTINPGSTTPLNTGVIYNTAQIKAANTTFLDQYFFTLSPALQATATASVLDVNPIGPPSNSNTNFGISNLFYQWVGIGAAVQITDALGNLITPVIPLIRTLTGATAELDVFTSGGQVLSNGGIYNFELSLVDANTPGGVPLPGAVFLFGSVLAGGIGGMRLIGRRRSVQAA